MISIRTLRDDDMPALRRVDEWAFATTMTDRRWEVSTAALERDRQLGAFVDADLAGHVAAYTFELTVPGATVPAAGVTWVSVFPGHRRRGVLRALMARQLGDLHETGEPVAVLSASEPAIYGRFGYGPASRHVGVTASRGVALDGPGPEGTTVALGDVADALEPCRAAYERARPLVPGMVTRTADLWAESAYDEPETRQGWSARRCAVAVDPDGTPTGYAWFKTRQRWEGPSPNGLVEVTEMLTTTPGASRALLDVVLDLDLTTTVEMYLPLDDPLMTLTIGTQRLQPSVIDQLWVRLVRLDEALDSRAYAAPVDVVLEVADEGCPWNAGRWRLAADPTGATTTRTTAPADLALDVAHLAAAYLGDDHLNRAVLAGLVTEHTAGAALALARAMRGDRAPYCPYVF